MDAHVPIRRRGRAVCAPPEGRHRRGTGEAGESSGAKMALVTFPERKVTRAQGRSTARNCSDVAEGALILDPQRSRIKPCSRSRHRCLGRLCHRQGYILQRDLPEIPEYTVASRRVETEDRAPAPRGRARAVNCAPSATTSAQCPVRGGEFPRRTHLLILDDKMLGADSGDGAGTKNATPSGRSKAQRRAS